MPIANRSIYPVFVSRIKVPTGVENELEYIVNATLANFIKQLSCLSLKANDIFDELTSSLIQFVDRTEALDVKIQDIYIRMDNSDISVVKPLVNQPLTVYRSHIIRDDELLDHTQRPDCINQIFNEAQSPPELFKFDEFRKNDEESMRFYTDPDFFLREWLKNARNMRKKKNEKKKKRKTSVVRRSRQPPAVPTTTPSTIIEEVIPDNNEMHYDSNNIEDYHTENNVIPQEDDDYSVNQRSSIEFQLIPPPPPIFANFPISLPPAPPPASVQLKMPTPSVNNLLAEIKKGSVLRPVSARLEVREKTKDFREFIKELRPAWENQSDDSDD